MSNDINQTNPYESTPPALAEVVGEVKKPASVVVFGILNLVYGALGTIGILLAIMSLFLDLPEDPNDPFQLAMEDPTYRLLSIGLQVVGGALSIVLLISGIGLINGKLYGRRLAVFYAIAAIVFVLVGSAINITYVSLPAFERASELPDGQEKIMALAVGGGMFFQPICGNIFPVLLLIFMMRAPVKRYFRIV